MQLPEPLTPAYLIERYKRFLADVQLEDGTVVTAHCPNSGSMTGLLRRGNKVLLCKSANKRRKLSYTWELVHVDSTWVGVNTMRPNHLIFEALTNKQIPQLADFSEIKAEVSWNKHNRLDLLLKQDDRRCFVEVKNVTLAEAGVAFFPDAKTKRGVKHLQTLMEIVRQGHRGVVCFLVNREDCSLFKPADSIDPLFGHTLRQAYQNGVEILVCRTKIRPPEIVVGRALDFQL
ncbi:MAG: DNA/RNA nuclease SfsA [bacterium]